MQRKMARGKETHLGWLAADAEVVILETSKSGTGRGSVRHRVSSPLGEVWLDEEDLESVRDERPLHVQYRRILATAKRRLTLAKKAVRPLNELLTLSREVEIHTTRERLLYKYQFSLQDAKIDTTGAAFDYLRSKGVDVP